MKRGSYQREQEFGVLVGGVLVLLSLWWIYRGKFQNVAHIALPVGFGLVVLAIIIPRALVYPNKAWMKLAEGMAFASTRIILTVVYFLVLTPIGLIKKAAGWDPLCRRAAPQESYWQPYSSQQRNPRHYERMY